MNATMKQTVPPNTLHTTITAWRNSAIISDCNTHSQLLCSHQPLVQLSDCFSQFCSTLLYHPCQVLEVNSVSGVFLFHWVSSLRVLGVVLGATHKCLNSRALMCLSHWFLRPDYLGTNDTGQKTREEWHLDHFSDK